MTVNTKEFSRMLKTQKNPDVHAGKFRRMIDSLPAAVYTTDAEGRLTHYNSEDDMMVIAEAADGEEAVKLAHETSPDIILMDVNMPGMGGIEATQKIVSDMSHVRVIGLSLHDDESVIEEMYSVGATAYLTKTEAFKALCATIRGEAMSAA